MSVASLCLTFLVCGCMVLVNCDLESPVQTQEIQSKLLRTLKGISTRESNKGIIRNNGKHTIALISGPYHYIADVGLRSSGTYHGRSDLGPQCSRMNVPKPRNCYAHAWKADPKQVKPWIQVDLGKKFRVTAIHTQGRGGSAQYVTSFTLAKIEANRIIPYMDPTGTTKVFPGNSDSTNIAKNALNPPLVATKVRLYVLCFNSYAALRWELYGYLY